MPFICVSTYVCAHVCVCESVCDWVFFFSFFEADRNERIEYSQCSKAQCDLAWSALHRHESYMLLWQGIYDGEKESKRTVKDSQFFKASSKSHIRILYVLNIQLTFPEPPPLDWYSSPFPRCSFAFMLFLLLMCLEIKPGNTGKNIFFRCFLGPHQINQHKYMCCNC